jgi:hypothetical protein
MHRELLSYMIDTFLMALHRPYIFTRDYSQRQVYDSSLAILDSQDRLSRAIQASQLPFNIGLTFPTFDAAVLLAVVLVSYPELYHISFERPYRSLSRAFERLSSIGSTMALAKAGAEILQKTRCRVVEAQERAGFPVPDLPGDVNILPVLEESHQASGAASASLSPDASPWQFEVNQAAMDWTYETPGLSGFDFSNLEAPMPLKELLLDGEMEGRWMPTQDLLEFDQQPMVDAGDNSLWNYLAGYSVLYDDQNTQ